jgi:uncharacterized protein (DUF736 family)
MAQIGTFPRAEDGSYTGTIKTLSLNIKARFIPAESSQNEKAPAGQHDQEDKEQREGDWDP